MGTSGAPPPRLFSRRIERPGEPNALTQSLRRRTASGSRIIDLTASNPTSVGFAADAAVLAAAFGDDRVCAYAPEPFGLDHVRARIASEMRALEVDVKAEQIVLTASTSEAYSLLFKLLCDPGDELLVPAPSYPLFEHLAAAESVRLRPYRLAYDGAFYIDPESLHRARTSRSRGVIVVNPNNPTGSYVKRNEVRLLGELGLPVISDEVFAAYDFGADTERVNSLHGADLPLVFALSGLSKLAAMPQMKLAWTMVSGEPGNVREALDRLELLCDSYLSVGAPVQHAAERLLVEGARLRESIRTRTARNLARVSDLLGADSPITPLPVEGGWYVTLRLPHVIDEEQWALTFLEEDGVLVHPGHFFDFESDAYAIVSLLTEPALFDDGVARVAARVGQVLELDHPSGRH